MAAYGLYTHIASNKFRSMLLLGGLFLLIYVLVYAGALLAEVLISRMRYKDALDLIGTKDKERVGGTERLEFNLRRARVLMTAGYKDDAVSLFEEVARGLRRNEFLYSKGGYKTIAVVSADDTAIVAGTPPPPAPRVGEALRAVPEEATVDPLEAQYVGSSLAATQSFAVVVAVEEESRTRRPIRWPRSWRWSKHSWTRQPPPRRPGPL